MLRRFVAVAGLIAALAIPSAHALTGGRTLLLSGGIPAWVLSGAAQDMYFATAQYYGCSNASCLTLTRASSKTDLLPSSASGFAYNTFGSGVLAITPGKGLLIEESRTNQLLNSTAPATQTTGTLANGTYTLWVNGSGTATMSTGTATGCGTGAASQGTPVNFTTSGTTGTCTVTVSGSLNAFQLELGSFGTSLIITAGATGTRNADVVQTAGALKTALTGSPVAMRVETNNVSNTASGQARVVSYGSVNVATILVNSNTSCGRYDGSFSLNETVGSGTFSGGLVATVESHSVSPAFDSIICNQGTEGTGTSTFSGQTIVTLGSINGASNFLDGYITRVTTWLSTLNATSRKGFSAP